MMRTPREVREYLSRIASGKSEAKREAAIRREAARKAGDLPPLPGRPRRFPKCPRYGSHRFSPKGKCPCGYARPS